MRSIRIPSDIDQEDRIIGTLTARQVGLIAIPAVLLWLIYSATNTFIPALVFVPVTVIISVAVGVLVVGKRDGLSMDRFAMAMLGHTRADKTQVTTTGDITHAPEVVARTAGPLPGHIHFSVLDIDADGVVDLGAEGAVVICAATSVNLLLQSEAEQDTLIGAFGRFCNSLEEPVQIIARAEVVELSGAIAELRNTAAQLPSVGLERAALDHARFLGRLGSDTSATSRSVFVVFRERTSSDASAQRLLRRAAEATTALASAGVTLRQLDRGETCRVIQRACDTEAKAIPNNEIITGRSN